MFAARSQKPAGISIQEALRESVASLQQAHVESASLDARLLLQHVLGVKHEELLMRCGQHITLDQHAAFHALVVQRAARKPMAHLTGRREFWGMQFNVTPATLDPRPDSEALIEAALKRIAGRDAPLRLLDLGTGTGCLLLALLSELPHATGLGIDASMQALEVARGNAQALGYAGRTQWQQGNWLDGITEKFDIILANPPYIASGAIAKLAPEVAMFEPKLALDGGADGLTCYRDILRNVSNALAPKGFALFEIGMGQQYQLEQLIHEAGLNTESCKKDLSGIPRCIIVTH